MHAGGVGMIQPAAAATEASLHSSDQRSYASLLCFDPILVTNMAPQSSERLKAACNQSASVAVPWATWPSPQPTDQGLPSHSEQWPAEALMAECQATLHGIASLYMPYLHRILLPTAHHPGSRHIQEVTPTRNSQHHASRMQQAGAQSTVQPG